MPPAPRSLVVMRTNHRARSPCRLAYLVFTAAMGCDLAYPLGDYQALDRDGAPTSDAAGAGPIQQMTTQSSNTRELVVALSKSTTTGDTLVLVAASSDTVPSSVSSAGISWTAQSMSSTHVAVAIWAGFVPAGGSSSVTVRWSSSPLPAQGTAMVHLSEWSGLAALGSEVHGAGTAGGPIATGSLLVKKGTGLLLAAAGGHNVVIGSPTNGFTALSSMALDDYRLELAYVVAPAEGAYATTWAYPSPKGWDALLVSFLR